VDHRGVDTEQVEYSSEAKRPVTRDQKEFDRFESQLDRVFLSCATSGTDSRSARRFLPLANTGRGGLARKNPLDMGSIHAGG
jgi:hypothetical protein